MLRGGWRMQIPKMTIVWLCLTEIKVSLKICCFFFKSEHYRKQAKKKLIITMSTKEDHNISNDHIFWSVLYILEHSWSHKVLTVLKPTSSHTHPQHFWWLMASVLPHYSQWLLSCHLLGQLPSRPFCWAFLQACSWCWVLRLRPTLRWENMKVF